MSAKAEYAVRAMVQLATAASGSLVKTEDLAQAQGIPAQFLVDILTNLRTDRLHRRTGGRRPRRRAGRPALLRADRGAYRRLAGAAGQHAFGIRTNGLG